MPTISRASWQRSTRWARSPSTWTFTCWRTGSSSPAPSDRRERSPSPMTDALRTLVEAIAGGEVEVVDLTQPLSERTPIIMLPPPFANTPGWTQKEISHYDDRGPAWYWNGFEGGEHVGTHVDAPIHWVTGKDKDDVSTLPLERVIGPAVVIDKREACAADPDYLLTIEDVRGFESKHGPLPEGGWLLYRTGWDERAQDQEAF